MSSHQQWTKYLSPLVDSIGDLHKRKFTWLPNLIVCIKQAVFILSYWQCYWITMQHLLNSKKGRMTYTSMPLRENCNQCSTRKWWITCNSILRSLDTTLILYKPPSLIPWRRIFLLTFILNIENNGKKLHNNIIINT